MLSLNNETFSIDKVDLTENKTEQFNFPNIVGATFDWPYLAFSTIDRHLFIYNVFQSDKLHMVELWNKNTKNLCLRYTYITEEKDMIIVLSTLETYYVYKIDLDQINPKGSQR